VVRCLFYVVLSSLPAQIGDGPAPGVKEPRPGTDPILRNDPVPVPPAFSLTGFENRGAREPLRGSSTNDGLLGTWTSQQTVRDVDNGTVWVDPSAKRGWQADESWKLGVAGPLFAFGQASASADDALQQDARLNGRAGLACQLPLPVGELLLRGGPGVNYSDVFRPDRVRERSAMLLEVQGRCPLLFGAAFEYEGTASPAMLPLDRDWASQEVRLALPVGAAGKLKFGARQRWDNVSDQHATTDGAQLFLGVELKH
jgi:hypothetical protein